VSRFLLQDWGSCQDTLTMDDITCLQLYQVTCSELTVDCEVEQSKIATPLSHL
jgi:hypothetical protein